MQPFQCWQKLHVRNSSVKQVRLPEVFVDALQAYGIKMNDERLGYPQHNHVVKTTINHNKPFPKSASMGCINHQKWGLLLLYQYYTSSIPVFW